TVVPSTRRGGGEGVPGGLALLTGACSGGVGEHGVSGVVPAGADELEEVDDQRRCLLACVGLVVALRAGGLLLAPDDPLAAQEPERHTVLAALGEEVAAEAEQVRPPAQAAPVAAGGSEVPAHVDQPLRVAATWVGVHVDGFAVEPAGGVPGGFGGFGG